MRPLWKRSLPLVALFVGVACGLNPQPEPPGADSNSNSDAGEPAYANGGGDNLGAGGHSSGGDSANGGAFHSGATGSIPPGGTGGAGPADSPDASTASDAGMESDGSVPDGGFVGPEGGACVQSSVSSLTGVSIRFPEQPCVFTLAEVQAGVTFTFEIVVTETVDGVITSPQDDGRCGTPSPGGLFVLEQVGDGSHSYCLCDVGLCAPGSSDPITLVPGVYPGSFTWDGVSWTGPSDFGNPKGAAFPAGSYEVTVGGSGDLANEGGFTDFSVLGTFEITLVP